jgi:hypothetical protein
VNSNMKETRQEFWTGDICDSRRMVNRFLELMAEKIEKFPEATVL